MPFNKKILKLALSNINQMELHNKIKFIRLSKNLTQGYIADELGIDVANYSRLERGETSITVERLKKIAGLLDVDLSILITPDDHSSKSESFNQKPVIEEYLTAILEELRCINSSINNLNKQQK
jgi:transcriptional regulator with XRE-family HTH domain